MRQAGRSDPAYRALREKSPLPLEKLFRDVDQAVEISLLPKRIGVDAIIFFQDILTPLAPMGAPFVFRPGPVLEQPVRTEQDVARLHLYDMEAEIPFVGETLAALRRELEGDLPVLGFAGAPLTLLYFLVEGKSPGGSAPHAEQMLVESPALAHALLSRLTEMTVHYLEYQIASGAQAAQLFESTADLLDNRLYREFALPYQKEVFARLGGAVPRILFAKGFRDLEAMKESGADVLSIGSSCTIKEARAQIGEETRLQGNVSNHLLAEGKPEEIEKAVGDCLESGGSRGHVLNLDHGVLQHTPWENVELFVACAKRRTRSAALPLAE
jgi:uroporphyrinogen decarboxylase